MRAADTVGFSVGVNLGDQPGRHSHADYRMPVVALMVENFVVGLAITVRLFFVAHIFRLAHAARITLSWLDRQAGKAENSGCVVKKPEKITFVLPQQIRN